MPSYAHIPGRSLCKTLFARQPLGFLPFFPVHPTGRGRAHRGRARGEAHAGPSGTTGAVALGRGGRPALGDARAVGASAVGAVNGANGRTLKCRF